MTEKEIQAMGSGMMIPNGVRLWETSEDHLMQVQAAGIPFLVSRGEGVFDGISYDADGERTVPCGFRASHLCFLGHVSTYDSGTGSWSTPRGDLSREQFIGDRLGDLEILYEDGDALCIPLVFGSTIWWDRPLRPNTGHGPYHEPFASDEAARRTLDHALQLNRFRPPHESGDGEAGLAYFSVVETEGRPIRAVRFRRNAAYFGEPLFVGLTVLSESGIDGLHRFPEPLRSVDPTGWKTIGPSTLRDGTVAERIEALQRVLYTLRKDCGKDVAVEVPPRFQGPSVRFSGHRYGGMLTNLYFHNLQDLLDKTDPRNQMTPTSTPKAPAFGEYPDSIGTWRKDYGRGCNDGYAGIWSRDGGRAGTERRKFGYGTLTPNETASFDRCLYLTLPPHWPRDITNVYGFHSKYDARTLDGQRIVGAPENDGHGAILLMRYADWLGAEDRRQWYEKHRQATVDAAEWICWSMDHPMDAGQPDGVLWSVTEPSGYGGAEIYSNALCLYGLMACADMALQEGDDDCGRRWEAYARRLREGILAHLVCEKDGRRIWLTHPRSSWQDLDEGLGPVFAATELFGYRTGEGGLDGEWLEIGRNTYEDRILSEPRYLHGRAFGYGYGFIAQAALLLDRMDDADQLVRNLCDHAFFDGPFPWVVPEGVVVHPSGKCWYRSGDHGNTAQQVEILKAIRILIGLDDLESGTLHVMPRLPDSIEGIEVSGFPVQLREGVSVEVGYDLCREEDGIRFVGRFGRYEGRLAVRLPLPHPEARVEVPGHEDAEVTTGRSGDRDWATVRVPANGEELIVRIR